MMPFRFGPVERQMFGVFHPAASVKQPTSSVLLCNPFGQEAVRAHRMYRVLAELLARRGIHVLRFDYGATGDSAGDDEEGDLDSWRNDVLVAGKELTRRAKTARSVWVGARLGGSLAALASTEATPAPDRLVLWEPVIDGRRYLEELASAHQRQIRTSYGMSPQAAIAAPNGEAIGFAVSVALREQLERLDESALLQARTGRVVVVSSPNASQFQSLATQFEIRGLRGTAVPLEHAFDWTSEEALNTALVPADALALLASQIESDS